MSLRVRSVYTLARLEVRRPPRALPEPEPKQSSLLPFVLLLLAVGTLCVLCLPAIAGAQTREDVAAELDKTDRVIEKAQDLLDETGAPRGRGALDMAVRLQVQARQAFASNNLRMAERLTRDARNRALAAVSGIRRSEDNEQAVERELERTDRVLEEVTERIGGVTLGARRLEQARGMQNRAWELFRNRSLRPALKMTLEAREMVAGMALRGRPGPGQVDRLGDHVERQLERLGLALEKLNENITPENTRGQDELNLAQASYRAAQSAFNDGQYLLAERHVRQTREALMRAVRMLEERLRAEDVEALISDARRRWENLGDDVEASGDSKLREWYADAGADLGQADDALRRGELKRALVQTRSAMGLLDRIADEFEF